MPRTDFDLLQMFRCQAVRAMAIVPRPANDPLAVEAPLYARSVAAINVDDVVWAKQAVYAILTKCPSLVLETKPPWSTLTRFLPDEIRDQYTWNELPDLPPEPTVTTLAEHYPDLMVAFATAARAAGVEDICGIDATLPADPVGDRRKKLLTGAIVSAGLITGIVGVVLVLRRTQAPSRTRQA